MTNINFYKVLNSKIKNNECLVGIVGVGYVGIQLFINFCKKRINTMFNQENFILMI